MPKQKLLILIIVAIVVAALAVYFVKFRKDKTEDPTPAPAASLPVNTIPVEERPFITLTPDDSGRYLFVGVESAPADAEMEYELVYQAGDKQEGVFGRIDFSKEAQPYAKKQLLGSQSAGGKITYHESITGGSLTTTYDDVKLKEQFNFLRFNQDDPTVSSSDVRFTAKFDPKAFAKDQVVVVMKTFGLPKELSDNLVAGPYGFFGPKAYTKEVVVSLKLPAGEHNEPALLVYDTETASWIDLEAKLDGDTMTASVGKGNVFVVTAK